MRKNSPIIDAKSLRRTWKGCDSPRGTTVPPPIRMSGSYRMRNSNRPSGKAKAGGSDASSDKWLMHHSASLWCSQLGQEVLQRADGVSEPILKGTTGPRTCQSCALGTVEATSVAPIVFQIVAGSPMATLTLVTAVHMGNLGFNRTAHHGGALWPFHIGVETIQEWRPVRHCS
jgi:hypothetical protein